MKKKKHKKKNTNYQKAKYYRFYIMRNIETNEYRITSFHDPTTQLPNLKLQKWEIISHIKSVPCNNREEYIKYKRELNDLLINIQAFFNGDCY